MSILVYDCEIVKAIQGKNESRVDGIDYCSGWKDYKGMGISCIGAFDYTEGRYRMFLQDNFNDFQQLLNSRKVLVGFNSIGFDNPLIEANGFTIPETLEQYDILVEVKKAAKVERFCAGYRLDDLCTINFNSGKSGHGGNAPIQWQRGEIGSVIDYCLNDVKLTVQLLQLIMISGKIKGPGERELMVRLP